LLYFRHKIPVMVSSQFFCDIVHSVDTKNKKMRKNFIFKKIVFGPAHKKQNK
jgi:hypothetical protein